MNPYPVAQEIAQLGKCDSPALLPLPPDRLYRAADIAALDFATTRELAPLHGFA